MTDFDTIVLLALIVAGAWILLLSYRLNILEKLIKNMFEAFFEDMEDEDEQDS